MRISLLGCVTAASVLVLAAAPAFAQKGPTGVGGGGAAPAPAAPSVSSGPTGGGTISPPSTGGSIGRGPTGSPGGAVVGSPGGSGASRGQWSGGSWSGHGGRWHGRHHRHRGGVAFGFAPYYGWGYDPFYYAQPACEMVRVRSTLPSGRRVWRWVERCY